MRSNAESILAQAVSNLGDHEVEVLARIATRLVKGQQTYGSLAAKIGDKRWNWVGEAREELFDGLVYLSVLSMVE